MEINNYPSWLVNVVQAKNLKKIGFDLPCEFSLPIKQYEDFDTRGLKFNFQKEDYNKSKDYWSIPSFEQVFEWFRSKGYHSNILTAFPKYKNIGDFRFLYEINRGDLNVLTPNRYFNTYEKARKELVNRLIKFYKENENNI